ncbi:MAG: thioredoxin family protein [Comamonas sp.]|nr:thioredoxin family protein [Comamonas sp.]
MMDWQAITTPEQLAALLQPSQGAEQALSASAPALYLVLWGGAHCSVCHSIKPRLLEMAAAQFPQLPLLYVDCHSYPAAGAQYGVFSLPVLRLYVDGQAALEYVRAFGLAQVQQEMTGLLQRLGV